MTGSGSTHSVEGLFAETPAGARLLGSLCRTCETPYFPKTETCHNPDCTQSAVEPAEFGPTGTLWSTCIQNYPPPPPVLYDEPFVPYGVGVVDLPNGLRVVGRLLADEPLAVEPGTPVELVIAPLKSEGDDGRPIVSWQWKPTA